MSFWGSLSSRLYTSSNPFIYLIHILLIAFVIDLKLRVIICVAIIIDIISNSFFVSGYSIYSIKRYVTTKKDISHFIQSFISSSEGMGRGFFGIY